MSLLTWQKKQSITKACLQGIRNRIEVDPFFLARTLYSKYQFKPFHRQWFEQALLDKEEICLGPRNFAKTTVRGIVWTISKMIQNPNIQLGIVSDTGPQAVHFVSEVKMQIERNKLLTLLYSHLKPGQLWRDDELTIIGATEIQKGATVTAFGYGGATGYEFDEIMVDDIVDFDNSRTRYQRDKLEDWIGMSLRPMLKAKGVIHFSGTRYHEDDYYGRLLKKGIATNSDSHRAILANGESLWPELWPVEKLMEIKEKIGSMRFNAQYQNDTALMGEGSIFKREWFKYFERIDEYSYRTEDGITFTRKGLEVYQTCDLAISQKTKADYFVILTFGVDRQGRIFILDLIRNRYSWEEQKRITIANYQSHQPLVHIGIESNQYQQVLADEINKITGISVKYLKPKGDKVTRAMSMSAKYETGKVYHYRKLPHLEDFEEELTSFPEGEHDDLVDAVSYISQCAVREGPNIRWI